MKGVFLVWSVVALSAVASAEPIYRVKAGGSIACISAKSVYETYVAPASPPPADCRPLDAGVAFEATNRSDSYSTGVAGSPIVGIVVGRPLAANDERGQPSYFRVNAGTVEAVRDSKGNYVQPSCDYPESYVTSKLLAGPDGRLYLKQGKVTIKCVNGEMRQIYQPLN